MSTQTSTQIDTHKPRSLEHQSSEPVSETIRQSQQCLSQLSQAFETQQLAKTRLLEQLYQDLTHALSDYEDSIGQTLPSKSRLENHLPKQHHLQWLCNQAQYYLTQPNRRHKQHPNRARWQIKAAIYAIAKFRLIVHLRNWLPGKTPKTIAWRDILPGFKL